MRRSMLRSRSAIAARICSCMSRGVEMTLPLRENARSFRVRSAARCVPSRIVRTLSWAGDSAGRETARSSALPMMTLSMLLKSWATPPASWPITSIFWDWRSCSSSRLVSVRSIVTDRTQGSPSNSIRVAE